MSASSPYVTSESTGSDGVLKTEGTWVPASSLGAKPARNVYAGPLISKSETARWYPVGGFQGAPVLYVSAQKEFRERHSDI